MNVYRSWSLVHVSIYIPTIKIVCICVLGLYFPKERETQGSCSKTNSSITTRLMNSFIILKNIFMEGHSHALKLHYTRTLWFGSFIYLEYFLLYGTENCKKMICLDFYWPHWRTVFEMDWLENINTQVVLFFNIFA